MILSQFKNKFDQNIALVKDGNKYIGFINGEMVWSYLNYNNYNISYICDDYRFAIISEDGYLLSLHEYNESPEPKLPTLKDEYIFKKSITQCKKKIYRSVIEIGDN